MQKSISGSFGGGRNRTRTYDPIDVNDVPSIVHSLHNKARKKPPERGGKSVYSRSNFRYGLAAIRIEELLGGQLEFHGDLI